MQPLFAEFASGDGPDRWQVCLADCHDYLSYGALADILYTEHLRVLEQADILIVRPRVDLPISSQTVPAIDVTQLSKRAPHASLHMLFTDNYEVMLSSNLNQSVADKLPTDRLRTECLHWLQDKELYLFLKQSNALFQARKNFVYRAPSKRHVNMFLRVGNVQRNRQVLDAFFFWMLPHLKGRTGILTETWSISSIALNAARLLERYRASLSYAGSKPDEPSQEQCHVDMLSSYLDDLSLVLPETRDFLRRAAGDGSREILVLLSAVATGNSLARLREAVIREQFREGEFEFLALYKLDREQSIQCLCDISSGIGGMRFTALSREEVGSRPVIEIDRGAYFPLEIKETPLSIFSKHAKPGKEFFTQYQNASVVTLHRTSVDSAGQELRHHGIYIDVEPMLRRARFRDKLSAEIATLRAKPMLVVTPPHRAGQQLVDEVLKLLEPRWEGPINVLVHPDLRSPEPIIAKKIKEADVKSVILVVDDVSVTGQRLSRYQQSLRELSFAGQVVYLVGVARPDSDKNWDRRVVELKYRAEVDVQHQVICIEKLILPDWDHKTCPWCAETRSLATLVQQKRLNESAVSPVFQRVMALELASIQKGLLDDAVWHNQGAGRLRLTDNSIFIKDVDGSATEADVIAAVAAAIQQMRTTPDEEKRLESTYPHVSVLNPRDYFGNRFNDDILRIAILRSATAAELERWTDTAEERRRDLVADFLNRSENRDIFRLELAVARLAKKVPQPELTLNNGAEMTDWPADLWRAFATLQ
jgi:hypothetical protein